MLSLEGQGKARGGGCTTRVSRCASLHCNVAKIYDACDTVNSCSTPKHISNVWHDSNSDSGWGSSSTDCVTFYVTVVCLLPTSFSSPCFVPPFVAPVCRQANNNVKYVRRFAIHTQKWMSAAHLNRNADCCVGSQQAGPGRAATTWAHQGQTHTHTDTLIHMARHNNTLSGNGRNIKLKCRRGGPN